MLATGFSQIDSHVPFGSQIYCWLHHSQCTNFDTLLQHANRYEDRYLAWEQVRSGTNPFFEIGTGFEGYFVGTCTSPEEVLRAILNIGQRMLRNLIGLHPFNYQFKSKFWRVLADEAFDAEMAAELAAEFGAQLA